METTTAATHVLNKETIDLWKRMELGLIPDEEIRDLMRIGLEKRLKWGYKPTHEQQLSQNIDFAKSLRSMKMATDLVETLVDKIYENPTSFQRVMFGSTIKESPGFFENESTTLDEANIKMLDLYCEKARIEDGQKILDVGCGTGPVMLHVAQKYKNCSVTGITNSISQHEFIVQRCKELNLSNVNVILADVTTLEMDTTYDRVFIIGLIEHMRNFELFLRKISKWITKGGFLFLEHYCHKTFAYQCMPFDANDWYTMFIFPPGSVILPSASFLLYFQDDLNVADHWTLSGNHFARSHEEWLKKIDANADTVIEIFKSLCGGDKEEAVKLMNFWRIFCITGSEMLGYNNGEEWMIAHYLFKKEK